MYRQKTWQGVQTGSRLELSGLPAVLFVLSGSSGSMFALIPSKITEIPHTSTDCQRLDSRARAGAKRPTQAQMKTAMERSPRIVPRKFIMATPSVIISCGEL